MPAASTTTAASVRVIVAGVGYRNLRDHSVGVEVADRLEAQTWPDDVVVEDISYNPIAVMQRLEDEPPERRFERAVVVGAVERAGAARAPSRRIAGTACCRATRRSSAP